MIRGKHRMAIEIAGLADIVRIHGARQPDMRGDRL